jgi:signal recognition particle GTPase
MIFCVLINNQKATRMKRKTLQYIEKDDEDEEREINSKNKGKRVVSGSGNTPITMNQLLKRDLGEEACR